MIKGDSLLVKVSMAEIKKEDLFSPVQYLAGVGPARAEKLQQMGIRRIFDLLFFFPRSYDDTSEVCKIAELRENEPATVCGTIQEVDSRNAGSRSLIGILISDGLMPLRAKWFNQPYRLEGLKIGQKVLLAGSPKRSGLTWEMVHPRLRKVEDDQDISTGEILPIYRLTEGLTQREIRQVVAAAVRDYASAVDEVFPNSFLQENKLAPIHAAIGQIHRPHSRESLEEAKNRFIYQELLMLQLAVNIRKHRTASRQAAHAMKMDGRIRSRIERLFPFDLTQCQKNAFEEIASDMSRRQPMNRLLHGDVGSGKTVVALSSMLLAVANGFQATLMVPTEILANQHFNTFSKILRSSRVRIGLLTGSKTAAQRREILKELAAGEIDFLIGTQSILNKEVEFPRLGLVIIDEQHRFGVRQRATLRDSTGVDPHYLVMTATPIPRSVSMTIFGDLDVSTIKTLPADRQPVHTYLCKEEQRAKWWNFVRQKLREGRQAYVVTPLVNDAATAESAPASPAETEKAEEGTEGQAGSKNQAVPQVQSGSKTQAAAQVQSASQIRADSAAKDPSAGSGEAANKTELASVISTFEELANGELEEFRIDLLHGGKPPKEKNQTMEKFASGETQVLVTTSVIEVGIDVPNATLMTIESAQRFGLAQLHQFRGRVTRGKYPGYVGLFAEIPSEESEQRLQAFTEITNGFELAEVDFDLRGPGDLFGTQQHGLPPFRIADLRKDLEVLQIARRDAKAMLEEDPELLDPKHEKLRHMMFARYSSALDLSDVG